MRQQKTTDDGSSIPWSSLHPLPLLESTFTRPRPGLLAPPTPQLDVFHPRRLSLEMTCLVFLNRLDPNRMVAVSIHQVAFEDIHVYRGINNNNDQLTGTALGREMLCSLT